MRDRSDQITEFLKAHGYADAKRAPLPGDASTRRYERLTLLNGQSVMLMDQAPALESLTCSPTMSDEERRSLGWNATARLAAGRIEAFVACAQYLKSQGLSAPDIHAYDPSSGLLISEDLGDGLLARLIEAGENETPLYLGAIEALAHLHKSQPPQNLSPEWPLLSYDHLALQAGADLFIEWFPKFAGIPGFSQGAIDDWHGLWSSIVQRADAKADVFIHRDFHAENILWLPDRSDIKRIGLIDFQDALRAHRSWDLHSLLQDARRDVSPELEKLCLERYFALCPLVDRGEFMRDYAALAALNLTRILGIFARLITRDHKPRYGQFMPRLWGYLKRDFADPELKGLLEWFNKNGFKDQLI